MVTLNFRLSEIGQLTVSLEGPEPFQALLARCVEENGLTVGGTIATRGGQVLRASDLIDDGDQIDIYPAISGG